MTPLHHPDIHCTNTTTPTPTNTPQITLPDDLPALSLLLLAGGAGVYAGSCLSSHVDMGLFRWLLVLLLLLGANVMLFAGAPARVALAGVLSIMAGIVLCVLALWNQPVWSAEATKARKRRGGGVLRRWLGGALYSQVALDEAEEDDDEEMAVDFQSYARKAEVELTKGAGGGGDGGKGGDRREIHI